MVGRIPILALAALLFGCDSRSSAEQAKVYLETGRQALLQDNPKLAKAQLEKAAVLAPRDPEIQRALSEADRRVGNNVGAIQDLERFAELEPQNPWPHLTLGQLYLDEGNQSLAGEKLSKAVALSLSNRAKALDARVLRDLVESLLQLGEVDKAEDLLKKINGDNPIDGESMALLARVFLDKGDIEAAAGLLDGAVRNGSSAYMRATRARLFFSRGKVSRAFRELNLAAMAAPTDTDIILLRAHGLLRVGSIKEAARLVEWVVAQWPGNASAKQFLAEIRLQDRDVSGAQEMWEELAQLRPRHFSTFLLKAGILEQMAGKSEEAIDKAISAYHRASEANPSEPSPFSRLWRLNLGLNRAGEAIAALESVKKLGALSAEEGLRLAQLYLESGRDPVTALSLVDGVLEQEPENIDAISLRRRIDEIVKANTETILGP